MARKKNGSTDDMELEQMTKAELSRLLRQYRIMEGDRGAYAEEMKILLQKQRKTIDILEKEKSELLYDLNYSKSLTKETRTEKNTNELKRLLHLHDELSKSILREKGQAKEFDLQIKKIEKELAGANEKSGGVHARNQNPQSRTRALQQLENRLDVVKEATVKLNRLQTHNQSLRQEIDHFLKERSLFNRAYQELSTRLSSGKKIIMNLMEQSTSAYDQREEAQSKLEALKQKGKQDLLVHGQEIKELQRKLDHDWKLKEFLGVKGQKRIMADLEAKEAFKRQQQKEAVEEKIRHYQSLLDKIREISEETEVDRLAAQFQKQEEENFALFSYVNELNNELKIMQEQLNMVNESVEEQRISFEEVTLKKRAAVETLSLELLSMKTQTETLENNLKEWRMANDKLLEGIGAIFELIKSDDHPVLRLLGEKITVTSFNVTIYMEAIGKRISQLRHLYDEMEKKKQKEAIKENFKTCFSN